ncbi:hypothetical protein DACRYDRAFT_13450 [Dacryopinax primogenitus]|uniref:Uncharacterized protein n=1 Tax=Dacryopinax primogenitus (strain DJM 731) TaxID=1858805 RepID=M5G598_DACPD|nr:uncharacterized protein DACRYDRAFT_13450 [Dacryopinax primogenitus]EJU05431.1 hypothetical protein DACRYDRAFT_13450 [Dacryopinax primogenitus]
MFCQPTQLPYGMKLSTCLLLSTLMPISIPASIASTMQHSASSPFSSVNDFSGNVKQTVSVWCSVLNNASCSSTLDSNMPKLSKNEKKEDGANHEDDKKKTKVMKGKEKGKICLEVVEQERQGEGSSEPNSMGVVLTPGELVLFKKILDLAAKRYGMDAGLTKTTFKVLKDGGVVSIKGNNTLAITEGEGEEISHLGKDLAAKPAKKTDLATMTEKEFQAEEARHRNMGIWFGSNEEASRLTKHHFKTKEGKKIILCHEHEKRMLQAWREGHNLGMLKSREADAQRRSKVVVMLKVCMDNLCMCFAYRNDEVKKWIHQKSQRSVKLSRASWKAVKSWVKGHVKDIACVIGIMGLSAILKLLGYREPEHMVHDLLGLGEAEQVTREIWDDVKGGGEPPLV